jgi:hypothetical protein
MNSAPGAHFEVLMKLFKCQACGNILYFENRTCGRCGHRLAYLPERTTLSALESVGDNLWSPLVSASQHRFLCRNAANDACNWLVPPGTNDAFCLACRHNGVIPEVTEQSRLAAWQQIELAKHRLNSVSRAMGERDLYPFVIAPPVVKKLGFVHDLIHGQL